MAHAWNETQPKPANMLSGPCPRAWSMHCSTAAIQAIVNEIGMYFFRVMMESPPPFAPRYLLNAIVWAGVFQRASVTSSHLAMLSWKPACS